MMNDSFSSRKREVIQRISACFFCVLLLSGTIFSVGCGKQQMGENTLVLGKDGNIDEYLVEEFPIDLYDIDEWENDCKAQIEAYNNEAKKEAVTLSDVGLMDSVLRCTLHYESDDAYFGFNRIPLYYGTISDAVTAGYSLLVPVNDVKSNTPVTSEELLNMKNKHICICSEPVNVVTYKKVKYLSEGASLGEDGKTVTVEGDKTVYIVFE